MWKLFKNELSYYKYLVIILYFIFAPFLIMNAIRGDFKIHLVRVMIITIPTIGIVLASEEKQSKKNTLYVRLPLPIRHIAFFRYTIWSSFWISLVLLFGVSSLIGNQGKMDITFLWLLLTMFSSMIILVSSALIIQDLRFCFQEAIVNKTLTICFALIPIIVAAIYLIVTISEPIRTYLARMLFTPFWSIFLTLISVGLVGFGVSVFERRRSFLE
jgi:hypothetical protein